MRAWLFARHGVVAIFGRVRRHKANVLVSPTGRRFSGFYRRPGVRTQVYPIKESYPCRRVWSFSALRMETVNETIPIYTPLPVGSVPSLVT